MAVHIKVVPESVLKLPVDIVYCVRSSLPHATRRLQTCIAVTKNTQMHESRRGCIRGVYTNSGSPTS